MTTEYKRMQQLRGSSAEWDADNIVPFDGELALERAPSGVRVKIGDGVTPYDVLPYVLPSPPFSPNGSINAVTTDPPVGAVSGDVWINTGTGNVKASWGAPAAGLAAAPGDLLLMDDASKWNLIPTASDLAGYVRETDLASPTGAALVGFQQTGTGAVARTALAKMREAVTPQDFGAVGNNVADDTVPLNRFLAAVAAGRAGHIPSGTYRFTAALTQIVGNNITITGDGPTALLLYAGASVTPGNLITIGDGTTQYYNLRVSGFRLDSVNQLTAGFGVLVRKIVDSTISIALYGATDSILCKLWDGLSLDHCVLTLLECEFSNKNTAVRWNDGIILKMGNTFIKGDGTGTGIHLAGGCWDFNTEYLSQLLKGVGCRVDHAVSAQPNQQLFFHEGSKFDTNTTAGIFIDDAAAATISKMIKLDCWIASTTTGNGLQIVNWTGGRIDSSVARILANSQSGILSADATCELNLAPGVVISDNQLYGIGSSVQWTVNSRATMKNNVPGYFLSNTHNRGLGLAYDPTVGWGLDMTPGGPWPIVAAASLVLSAGSGLVILMNDGTGAFGMFFCAAGNVVKINGDASMVAGTPAASQIGLGFSGGFYRVTNGYAATQNIFVSNMRCRSAS